MSGSYGDFLLHASLLIPLYIYLSPPLLFPLSVKDSIGGPLILLLNVDA